MNIKHFVKENSSVLMMSTLAAAVPALVLAGAGTDTDFQDVFDQLVDWSQGTLGRVIAVAAVLIGIIGGIARQSLMSFAIGIAAGLGLNYAPVIIDGLFTATLPLL